MPITFQSKCPIAQVLGLAMFYGGLVRTKNVLGTVFRIDPEMEIVAGSCQVQIDGENEINEYPAGSTFLIPANSGFNITVATTITEYICSFLD